MPAYYNEFDTKKAAWLRELIKRGLVAPGDVDERSIHDVRPDDLRGYRQCHFFAGIGVWSYALRLAGWDDDRPVWTGSCPCPSFSAAGKGAGFADPRHLWPVWMPLIRESRPPVVFGEQADAAVGHGWLDLVSTDLEASAYAVGAAVLGACSVGAPHRRQRLYFAADSDRERCAERTQRDGQSEQSRIETPRRADAVRCGHAGELGYPDQSRPQGSSAVRCGTDQCATGPRSVAHVLVNPESVGWIGRQDNPDGGRRERASGYRSADGGMAYAEHAERRPEHQEHGEAHGRDRLGWRGATRCEPGRTGPLNGFWRDADWIFCRDRRWRPVRPGSFPLAHGAPARMVRLRGYGDAINTETAAEFVRAYMEAI